MKLAIIKTGGKQYIVKEGDTLKLEKVDASEGDQFVFDHVLMTASDADVNIGNPLVAGALVTSKVLKQGRSKKVIVFHYHNKTRYKKKAGHRQHFTEVEILNIG